MCMKMRFAKVRIGKKEGADVGKVRKKNERFDEFLERLLAKLPDKLTGDSEHMRQILYRIYGQQAKSQKMMHLKLQSLKNYLLIVSISILIFTSGLLSVCLAPSDIVYRDGSPYAVKRPMAGEKAQQLTLRLSVLEGEAAIEKELNLTINPEKAAEEEEPGSFREGSENMENSGDVSMETESAALEREIRNVVRSINKSEEGESLILPETLPGGAAITWEESKTLDFLLVIPLGICALMLVYSNRYKLLKKEEEEAKNSIKRELPEFMNKLVLLLNAGLVLSEAFEKLIGEKEGYFYTQLEAVHRRVKDTNAPFSAAFREFAVRSGVKELVRLSNIINDNVGKGAELSEKLRCESEMLWFARKKEAEERGRLAETKLTLPLAILLLSLVTVTVAPALMEM